MTWGNRVAVVAVVLAGPVFAVDAPQAKSAVPPAGVQEISVTNSLDGVAEPVWFLPNASTQPAPLLVHLHSWSARLGEASLAKDCIKRG